MHFFYYVNSTKIFMSYNYIIFKTFLTLLYNLLCLFYHLYLSYWLNAPKLNLLFLYYYFITIVFILINTNVFLSIKKYKNYYLIFICISLNCFSVTSLGASIITSWALLFNGNAITSRIFGSSFKSIIILSIPGAIPAWGGAP